MVQIKGSAIKETINQIKSRAGEEALQKILCLLDEETRTICQNEIFPSSWYPLDVFTRFLEVEIRVLADGKEEMRITTLSISKDPVPPSEFIKPAGYTEMAMPDFGGLGGTDIAPTSSSGSAPANPMQQIQDMQKKMKSMLIEVNGALGRGVTAKDVALSVIGRIGTAGGTGYAVEFGGSAVRALSMEARMTLCNMAIEAGARAGMVAVDEITIEYLRGRPFAPQGEIWNRAVAHWRTLKSDDNARFDFVVRLDAREIKPQVTWGTSPEMVVAVDGRVPDPDKERDEIKREGMERALTYMGLKPNTQITDIRVDKVFIGSCTNSRIEDLRAAAQIVRGRRVAANVRLAMVVPGSGLVKEQAEKEGLDRVFRDAGFEWRQPGCSMCLAMNDDRLEPGERCASTSNRNFEGRQGAGGRTHLVSPAMAAGAAIAGHFVDVRSGL